MSNNFKEQLRQVRKEVRESEREARAELRQYEQCDDVSFVTGLRSGHELLVVSGNTVFPTVRACVRSVTTAPKAKELGRLAERAQRFDRIFFARNSVLAETTIRGAVALLAPGGLLCFFSDNNELRGCFIEAVEAMWPAAEIWMSDSNIGPVIMTNAAGPTSYQD